MYAYIKNDDFRNGFTLLDASLSQYTHSIQQEKQLLFSVKEMLESELSSHVVQKDMLQSDLNAITGQYEALKAAYHELSYESATHHKQKSFQQAEKERVLTEYRDQVMKLEADRQMAQLQFKDNNDKMLLVLATMEEQVRLLNLENAQLVSTVNASKGELGQYHKLVESYKKQLKDLCSGRNNSEKRFLDSFEEVMQEEMMTMKSAFEAKLRAAQEDAEVLSRKHQLEMSRLQNKSPYSLLNSNMDMGRTAMDIATAGTKIQSLVSSTK